MARRLKGPSGLIGLTGPSGLTDLIDPRAPIGSTRPRRRIAWALLVLGVVAFHGCVTERLAERLSAFDAERDLPPRLEVAYVRQMTLSAPPAAAPAAPVALPAAMPMAKSKPKSKPKAKPKPPKAASAPEATATSTPEPKADLAAQAADPIVAASSEPSPAASAGALAGDPASAPEAASSSSAATGVAAAASSAPALATAPAPASSASGAAPAFEWPASTRLTYLLTGNYRGDVSGSAQVEWVRIGSHYQVHVDFIVGPKFAPLITQRSTSDGEITAAGLAPRRYDQDIKVLFATRPRQTVVFDPGQVVLANGDVRPTLPGVQDSASQFVQLAYVFGTRPELLRVGGSVDIPLALPRKVAVWTYDVADEAVIQTPFGPVTGIHLKPQRPDQRAGSLSVEMWMAPQLRYLPVRMRFEQDAQTYVDLTISELPALAR